MNDLFPLRKLQHIDKYTDTFPTDKESACLLDDVTPGSSDDLFCNARLDIDKLFCLVSPGFETSLSNKDHVSGPSTNTCIRYVNPVRDVDAVLSVNSETSMSDSTQLLGSAHVLDTLSYSAPHDNNCSTKDVVLTTFENEPKHSILSEIPLVLSNKSQFRHGRTEILCYPMGIKESGTYIPLKSLCSKPM